MSVIHTVRLKAALPILVICSFGLLLIFSIFYQHKQMLENIDAQAFEDVRQLLVNTELQIETLTRHNEQDLIAEEISGYGAYNNINAMVLADESGLVIQATRYEWVGRPYRDIFTHFKPEQINAALDSQNSNILFSDDRQRILGCQSVVLAAKPGQIRPTKIGVLLVDYDISRDKSTSWDLLIRSIYPIVIIGILLMLAMSAVISMWVDLPLRHLTEVVRHFAMGDYKITARLTGASELTTLSNAWNQMSQKLVESISQLEESKERFAVTLFSIGDAVIATDTENRVTFMNNVAEKLIGWSLSEIEGQPLENVFKIINAETGQFAESPVKRVLETGNIVGLANHTVLIARDGTEYQIADSAAPIRRDNKIFGVVLVFRDVTEEYALRQSLLNERALLRCLIDAMPDLIFYKDSNSVYLGCNKAFTQFSGLPEQEHVGKSDFELFDANTARLFRKTDLEMFDAGQSRINEEWVTYPDGRQVLLDTIKTPFYAPDGKLLGLVGVSRNITDRKLVEQKLADNEEMLRSLGNNLPNGYIYRYTQSADGEAGFNFISAGVEKIHGIAPHEVLRDPMSLLNQVDSEQMVSYQAAMARSAGELSDFSMELLVHRPDGSARWVQLCSRPKRMPGLTVWDGVAIDITEKKLSEEQIWRQANFDPLTGLPNRRMLVDRLEQEIKKSHRNESSFAIFFIDLDRFKEINDTLGHNLGDELLQIAAQRLQACVRETDTVARLGGDEFTIILTDLDAPEIVDRIAQQILISMTKPFLLDGEQSYASASIGITLYPIDSTDAMQLIKNADQAMYAAKDLGGNCYSYYTQSMQEAARNRLSLTQDLRVALGEQQFQVYYQPIVELKTGQINKAEALIRWRHPGKGFISPALFIPIAEEIGLIHEIGDWVFKQAAQEVKSLRSQTKPGFQISINKSPVQFRPSGSNFNWHEHLESLGLDGNSVVIEITEGLLLDASTHTKEKLLTYRDFGIEVSLDDFGTGYSSLSYLKKFDIDYIKIDQSFVRNLSSDSGDMALCEAMIVMAHRLGIQVIAEGIETEEQRLILQEAGCDFGQGYLFSKPLPAEEFQVFLLQAE